jgi:hypothetical protein
LDIKKGVFGMYSSKGKTLEELKVEDYQIIDRNIRVLFKIEDRIKVYVENKKGKYEPLLGFRDNRN